MVEITAISPAANFVIGETFECFEELEAKTEQ